MNDGLHDFHDVDNPHKGEKRVFFIKIVSVLAYRRHTICEQRGGDLAEGCGQAMSAQRSAQAWREMLQAPHVDMAVEQWSAAHLPT